MMTAGSVYLKREIDIGKCFKKFSNRNAMAVTKELFNKSPLTARELHEITKIEKNILNHTLQDMIGLGLILLEDKNYYLTNYGVALLNGFKDLTFTIGGLSKLAPVLLPDQTKKSDQE